MCNWFFIGKCIGDYVLYIYTLLETNSSHLKMAGWKTIVSFWDGFRAGAIRYTYHVIYTYTHVYSYHSIHSECDSKNVKDGNLLRTHPTTKMMALRLTQSYGKSSTLIATYEKAWRIRPRITSNQPTMPLDWGEFSQVWFIIRKFHFKLAKRSFSPNSLLWGLLLKKKEVCTGLRALAQLGVAWAWRGRGLGVAYGRGVGAPWAWRGRGVGVGVVMGLDVGVAGWAWVWAWLWARLGRGRCVRVGVALGVAWAWAWPAAWAWPWTVIANVVS